MLCGSNVEATGRVWRERLAARDALVPTSGEMKSSYIEIAMKQVCLFLIALTALPVMAEKYTYVWSEVFPNYEKQTPKSDFTLDDLFQIDTEKATGVTGPQFLKDNKAGLMLRLYANNTLKLSTLNKDQLTNVEFVISGNGCASLAEITPSTGKIDSVYVGKDATETYREYRVYWSGETSSVTFSVGAMCKYGYDCVENKKTDEAGTFMSSQMIITTQSTTGLDETTTSKTIKKVIVNGQLHIIRDGRLYNALGVEIE